MNKNVLSLLYVATMNNKNLFFLQKIDSYLNLSKEIASLHITVPLNMLCLNCDDVNQELSARAARLADRMIQYVVDQNRDKNRGYELNSVPFTLPIQIRAAFQAGTCVFARVASLAACVGYSYRMYYFYDLLFYSLESKRD